MAIRVSAGGREVLTLTVPPTLPDFSIAVPLDGLEAMAAGGSIAAIGLKIESSASYTPITVGGLGADIREFSFLIKSCGFE